MLRKYSDSKANPSKRSLGTSTHDNKLLRYEGRLESFFAELIRMTRAESADESIAASGFAMLAWVLAFGMMVVLECAAVVVHRGLVGAVGTFASCEV